MTAKNNQPKDYERNAEINLSNCIIHTYLEINVGAGEEEVVEFGVSLNIFPLSGPVLRDAGAQRFLLLGGPLLLRIAHPIVPELNGEEWRRIAAALLVVIRRGRLGNVRIG